MSLNNRYDFVFLFDVKDGNPNGDPDAGNLPRLDAETGNGLVTDVSLKRKVRNYVALKHSYASPHNIYVREKAVLGRAHVEAFNSLEIELGEETRLGVPSAVAEECEDIALPEGVSLVESDNSMQLVFASDLDKKAVKDWAKGAKKEKAAPAKLLALIADGLKQVKARRPEAFEVERGRMWMCENYFDVRAFGAVMSLKSAPNCGQVRGPVQLTFARSVAPVVALEHSITRMAVATEAEAEKQQGDNRTMGRKFTVPYGLYRAHGFVSAHLAKQTGFGEDDLNLLWEALANMFDHDRSAARGEMSARGLYVFRHESELGDAPAHALFDLVTVKQKDMAAPARSFSDFEVAVPAAGPLAAFPRVTLERLVG